MERRFFEFVAGINYRFGWLGSLVVFLFVIGILALTFYLLNKLPESKKVIVWSKCSSCKYKCRNSKVFVFECPKYEMPKWNGRKSPPCPIAEKYDGCKIDFQLENPTVLWRDDERLNIK